MKKKSLLASRGLVLALIGVAVAAGGWYAYQQLAVQLGKSSAATDIIRCQPATQTVLSGKPVTFAAVIAPTPPPTPVKSPSLTRQPPLTTLPPPPSPTPKLQVFWTANGGTPSQGVGLSFTTSYKNTGLNAVNYRIKVKYGNAETTCAVTVLPLPTSTPPSGAQVSVVMDPNFPAANVPMGAGAFLGKLAFTTSGSEDARLMGFFVNLAIVPGSPTNSSRPIGRLYLSANGAPVAEGVLQAQSQIPGWLWQFTWSGYPLPRGSTQELLLSGDVLPQSQNPNGPGQRFYMTIRSASDLNVIGIPSGLRASLTNRFPIQNNTFTLIGNPTPTPTPPGY